MIDEGNLLILLLISLVNELILPIAKLRKMNIVEQVHFILSQYSWLDMVPWILDLVLLFIA